MRYLKTALICSIALLLFVHGYASDRLQLVYTNIGVGTWTTFNPGTKDSYLNSFKPDFYFKKGNLSWHIGIPLQYSIEYIPRNPGFAQWNDVVKYSFNVVDLATDLGWKIGPVEPTIGIALPTGYNSNDFSGAWVGSGNRQAVLGLNFSLGNYTDKIHGGGNVNISTTINGFKDGAAFDAGVITTSGSLKGTWRVNNRWETGADVYITYGDYGRNWEKVQPGWKPYMRTTSIVPALSVRRQLSPHTDVGLRAGYGASFDPSDASKKPTQVIVGGLSLAIY